MKTRKTISTALYFLLAALVGFLVGIFVNFPSVENNEVSGTIGKVNNYRNVTVTEADIELRSELINNINLLDGYTNFYSFHYVNLAELTDIIDDVVLVCENDNHFCEQNQKALSGLKSYRKSIERPRADLMLAMLTLKNINNMEQTAIIQILNNANIAIVQLNYNEGTVSNFAVALRDYIVANNDKNLDQLIEVHDRLVMLQVAKAIITTDKPMLKFYDQHEFFSNTESINVFNNAENVNAVITLDCEVIKNSINNQASIGNVAFENQEVLKIFNVENVGAIELVGGFYANIEKLGFLNQDKLGGISDWINNVEGVGSKFDLNFNSDKLQNIFNSVENLGMVEYHPRPNGPF